MWFCINCQHINGREIKILQNSETLQIANGKVDGERDAIYASIHICTCKKHLIVVTIFGELVSTGVHKYDEE